MTAFRWGLVVLAAWAVIALVVAPVLGRMIRLADLKSDSLTDVELEACRSAVEQGLGDGTRIIWLTNQHRLIVNVTQHSIARIFCGRRTELGWPQALTVRRSEWDG